MADAINLTQLGNLPPELYEQQQALNRQQQMATMLMQQNQQPQGQMVSGRYVPTSFFQNLQPVANMLTGAYLAKQGDTKAAQLAKQLREGKESERLAALQQIKAGNATGALELPNIYGGAAPYQSALIEQAIPKKPSSVLEFEYAKEHPELLPYLMQKANAGAARTSLNVQNQLPFKEQIQKEVATTLIKDFDTLKNVPATLANMDKMVQLSKQPIFAGVGGESKLQFVKLLNNNLGTNISPEAVKNTEEFRSASYMGIMDNLKKTDSNPTVTQQNALKEAIGSLGTDPSAIPRVVGVMRDVLQNKAKQHNDLVEQTVKKGIEYPYDIRIQLPESAPAPKGNVRSLADEILSRKPGAPR
jgi:hypothetical protein